MLKERRPYEAERLAEGDEKEAEYAQAERLVRPRPHSDARISAHTGPRLFSMCASV